MKKIILVLLPLLLFAACSRESDAQGLVGLWSATSENETYTTRYDFKDDGTYEITSTSSLAAGVKTEDGKDVFSDTKSGKYTTDGDKLTLENEYTQDDGKKSSYEINYTYSVEGDRLTLETEQGVKTEYERVQE